MISDHQVIDSLQSAMSAGTLYTQKSEMHNYIEGWRFGSGSALAVALPEHLSELWTLLNAASKTRCVIIMQAANTGLTGGSTPFGEDYDRPVLVINAMRLKGIFWVPSSDQVICLPGTTLDELEKFLRPLNRAPHSELGSSCIGASVIGGIANNSGGALINRGPAYTEASVFARRQKSGELQLVNKLGVQFEDQSPQQLLDALETGRFESIEQHECNCSYPDYDKRVRDITSNEAARYNANTQGLMDASGSAGKIAIFAVRLDTFPLASRKQLFLVSSSKQEALAELRKEMLTQFENLPAKAEYLHRECFTSALKYGLDTTYFLRLLGTDRIPFFFKLKSRIERLHLTLAILRPGWLDRSLQIMSKLLPIPLARDVRQLLCDKDHFVLLEFENESIDEAEQYFNHRKCTELGINVLKCTPRESRWLWLIRFAAAGAAQRATLCSGPEAALISLDIALPRNTETWFEQLPDSLTSALIGTLYYGHFLCYVFHQDYILDTTKADYHETRAALLELCLAKGAKYPAEHNVGHLYCAEPGLAEFYRDLDPTNTFNPGIGGLSKQADYR